MAIKANAQNAAKESIYFTKIQIQGSVRFIKRTICGALAHQTTYTNDSETRRMSRSMINGENNKTFTLNAWINGQHKFARNLKIFLLGECWHDVEKVILSKVWVVYINFMFNVLGIDGSSCQMPREPFASFFKIYPCWDNITCK